MTVSSATLRRIAAMPEQAMVEALLFLAEQLEGQEAIRAKIAVRQARYRKKRLCNGDNDVIEVSLQRQNDVAPRGLDNLKPLESKEERNPPISPPLPSSKPLPSEPEGFDAFWAIYPKRDGTADRKGAMKAFGPALKRVDLETLLDATRAYAADMKAKGKVGTEFVKQARSWLNGDLWTEYQPKPQSPECSSGVYVQYGTEQGDAWEHYFRTVRKRVPPRDRNNGWYFPTEFPTQSPDRSAA